ncbi:MAG: peptidase [Prochloraceae cyanobacterium]|nr:peptidase [Prochloraceae cyanobacterium]
MDRRLIRNLHRQIAPILFLPLFLTALTGIIYQISLSWFDGFGDLGSILMSIHTGEFLGKNLKVFYVILNAFGVFVMLFTGIYMTSIFRSKPK